ncbi:MAG: alkaline phosphatase family protein [Rhodocyclaceae bacterium]
MRGIVLMLIALGAGAAAAGWRPAHTVLVVLENRSFEEVVGNRDMPFLNALAADSALMTGAGFATLPYGIVPAGEARPLPARPSQPNYLYLFSGHHQGVTPGTFLAGARAGHPQGVARRDAQGGLLPRPVAGARVGIGNGMIPEEWRPFTTPNLGAALIASGASFASFCESLPHPLYDGAGDPLPLRDEYRRKHNAAINWVNLTGRALGEERARFLLPASANLGFTNTTDARGARHRGFAVDANGLPIGYEVLPEVSLVVPNERHDLHSGSPAQADAWLERHIGPYARWAREHDSLLVVTFDEAGREPASGRIVTLFSGPPDRVRPGRYGEPIDHLNVLATLLDRHGALDRFRSDFRAAWGDGPEAARELANLRPVRDVFGEGPALQPPAARH